MLEYYFPKLNKEQDRVIYVILNSDIVALGFHAADAQVLLI